MIARLTGVTIHPAATFAEIAREPTFLAPWLLASLLFAVPMIAAVQRIGPARLFSTAASLARLQPELADYPAEDLAAAIALLFQIVVVFAPVVAIPTTAVCLMPFARGASARQLIAVAAWAALPPAVGMGLTAMLVLVFRDPARLSLESLAPLNLGVLIPASFSRVAHNLAATLEFFSAWSVYLLSEGIAAATGMGLRRALLVLALPLLILAWLIAGAAAML